MGSDCAVYLPKRTNSWIFRWVIHRVDWKVNVADREDKQNEPNFTKKRVISDEWWADDSKIKNA